MDTIIAWIRSHTAEEIQELLRGIFMQGVACGLGKVEFDNEGDGERMFTEVAEWLDADASLLTSFVQEEIQSIEDENEAANE